MKKIKLKNDYLFNTVITVCDCKLKDFVVNNFGSYKDYYIRFIYENYELELEEAKSIVERFFIKDGIGIPLRDFFNIVKSLQLEVIKESELTKKKLLDKEFIVEWFSADKYIGD